MAASKNPLCSQCGSCRTSSARGICALCRSLNAERDISQITPRQLERERLDVRWVEVLARPLPKPRRSRPTRVIGGTEYEIVWDGSKEVSA